MKRLWIVFAVLLFLLIALSCAPEPVGMVGVKGFEEAREWTTTTFTTVGKVMIPNTHHHTDDEDWTLTLLTEDAKEARVEVTKEYWDSVEIGDYLDCTNQCVEYDPFEKGEIE